MSSSLFNAFMDGCMREIKYKAENAGARLDWSVVACLCRCHCFAGIVKGKLKYWWSNFIVCVSQGS